VGANASRVEEILIVKTLMDELAGMDPGGYTGIAWSIGGAYDRAWLERPIFGKIRYMSYNWCRSKFDIRAYVNRIAKLEKS
jgi:deoxyribodipyrimidine photo-lyase